MQSRALLLALAWVPLVAAAGCGTDPPASFSTYQACFDDQVEVLLQPVATAIVTCCLDHPIAGMAPACGATQPDCVNYLTANLNQTSASTVEVMDSCTAYITKKNAPPPQ